MANTEKRQNATIGTYEHIKMLSREEELDLISRWKDLGDKDAREKLCRQFLPLITKIAKYYTSTSLTFDDFIQIAYVAFLDSLDGFEPEKGNRLAPYAEKFIRGKVLDAIVEGYSIARISPSYINKVMVFQLPSLIEDFELYADENGIPNTDEERHRYIAERLVKQYKSLKHVTPDDIKALEERRQANWSLDAPMSNGPDGGDNFIDNLKSRLPSPEKTAENNQKTRLVNEWAKSAMSVLTDREQEIITERHLVEKEDITTHRALSDRFGVSSQRIGEIERNAIKKMRKFLVEQTGCESDIILALQ